MCTSICVTYFYRQLRELRAFLRLVRVVEKGSPGGFEVIQSD